MGYNAQYTPFVSRLFTNHWSIHFLRHPGLVKSPKATQKNIQHQNLEFFKQPGGRCKCFRFTNRHTWNVYYMKFTDWNIIQPMKLDFNILVRKHHLLFAVLLLQIPKKKRSEQITHRRLPQSSKIVPPQCWGSRVELQSSRFGMCENWPIIIPIGSMYGIFTYIWLIFMVNVAKYTIHGSYGIGLRKRQLRYNWNDQTALALYYLSRLLMLSSAISLEMITQVWKAYNL